MEPPNDEPMVLDVSYMTEEETKQVLDILTRVRERQRAAKAEEPEEEK